MENEADLRRARATRMLCIAHIVSLIHVAIQKQQHMQL